MPFSNEPWSNPEADLSVEDYAKVCLIDMNPEGKPKVKGLLKLPVKSTPAGGYNKNGIHAAAAALAGARGGLKGVTPDAKRKAAVRLIGLYSEMGEIAPEAVYRIAGKKRPAEKS